VKEYNPQYDKRIALNVLNAVATPSDQDKIREADKANNQTIPHLISEIQFFHDLPKKTGVCPDDPTCKTVIVKQKDFTEYNKAVVSLVNVAQAERGYNLKFIEILDKAIGFSANTAEYAQLKTVENAELRAASLKVLEFLKIAGKQQENLEQKAQKIDEKIDAAKQNQLTETENGKNKLSQIEKQISERSQKLTEMQDEINTLKLHVKPNFKAKLQVEDRNNGPTYKKPYSYGEPQP
jgi:hypothetical protein